jgi:hypothetical protein
VLILEPTVAHARLGLGDFCRAHDQGPDPYGWDEDGFARQMAEREARIWRVIEPGTQASWVEPRASTRFEDGQLLHRPARVFALEVGTRLRLDAWTSGRYFDGGDHTLTKRRFCVLDGALAGTCWTASDSVSIEPGGWRVSDPVEPMTTS